MKTTDQLKKLEASLARLNAQSPLSYRQEERKTGLMFEISAIRRDTAKESV